MGHWNRDRDCEGTQLTLLGMVPPVVRTRAQNPASVVNPFRGGVLNMRNAPPKWSKLWTDIPRPGDDIGAYTTEQLEQMNQEFTTAVERVFHSGDESEIAAAATYDLRRR
jgi:hypothetical protein